MKNYIGFVNDHSSSMKTHARAAVGDYNANITAVKEAASREMLDTVVSVVGLGYPQGHQITRQVTISNPHVLKPITQWPTIGGTPLFDGIGNMIELLIGLPDASSTDVSFLVMVTTDGEEAHSKKHNADSLRRLIQHVSTSGRWTFVFRIPINANTSQIDALGIPMGNIQKWDTTSSTGMTAATAQTTSAMDNFFVARSAGAKSSSAFYATAAAINLAVLEDISKKVSLYVVPMESIGIEIRLFILKHRMEYLKGAAFYQLTKTEARVSHTKLILVRERVTGKIYGGQQARTMIGLPTDRNARLHPGDHKNFDLFIQSESVNRKLVPGSGVVYWKEVGVPFTDADLAYLQPKATGAVTAPVHLLAVPVSTTPTKSPIPVTPNFCYFETREEARDFCESYGIVQSTILKNVTAPKGRKWSVPSSLMKTGTTSQQAVPA